MIKLNNVNKYYNKGNQNEIHVINDVSLELPEKGIVALFGKSGCGKTTLLNVIGGLDKFESGNITIDGNDITEDTDYIRNKYIGYIFQNYNLNKNVSCYDNVLDALKLSGVTDLTVQDELVVSALKNVGIEKYKKRLPSTLSGGQQQRVAIARALVKNPKIILADEPTGNLDENNTIMIMNLLKKISMNHLVLLVTHEEKLVQNYCDMIVNISDGKIINVINHSSDHSLESKNKNDIYLGELEKKEIVCDNSIIEYYGDDIKEKVKIKLVNNNGILYLKVDSNNVKIIDDSNEIKLKEGKFIQKKIKENIEELEIKNIDEYQTNKFAKLFNLKDSIKSGFINNFVGKKKKREKAFHRLLVLFSIVIVFITAIFGTAFKELEKVESSYNHNIFYVNISSKNNEELIKNNINNNSYIDFYQMNYNYNIGDSYFDFNLGGFETVASNYRNSLSGTGVILSSDLIKNSKVIAGSIDNKEAYEIVLSKGLADKLLEDSKFGNIVNYDDLIGLYCNNFTINNRLSIVKGVVDTKDNALYVNPTYLAQYNMERSGFPIKLANSYDIDIDNGEVVYLSINNKSSHNVGDLITINGNELKVKEVKSFSTDYENWLQTYHPSLYISQNDYFDNIIKSKYFDYNENYDAYYDIVYNEYYFDYLDVFYQKYDEYIENYFIFEYDVNLYLYFNKNIEMAKYNFMPQGLVYYWAKEYKKIHNIYPMLDMENKDQINSFSRKMDEYISLYMDSYYLENSNTVYRNTYLVSENDLINISKISGEIKNIDEPSFGSDLKYLTIHSSNPAKTLEWLESLDLEETEYENKYGYNLIISPNDLREKLLTDIKDSIMKQIITLISVLLIMCICMFFIMKSSVMNRIKEIGIYRAIGVSKNNLLFKYLIEIIVLTTGTILIGFILSSIFISFAASISQTIISIFYYPWYLSLAIIILLYLVSIIAGLIPIINLIRKTPSEILSKYDI